MSQVQARKTVLVSAFLLAAITIYRDRSRGGTADTFKSLWGVGVISLILSIAADFAPTVAGPFAALVVLGSLTNGGDKIIRNALGKAAAKAPSGPTNTPTGPTTLAGVTSVQPRQTTAGGTQ